MAQHRVHFATALVAAAGLALLAGCPYAGDHSNAPPTPAPARVEQTAFRTITHDFGVVRPGRPVSHRFTIANPSHSTWTVEQIRTSCGCTVAQLTSDMVPSGGKVEAEFSYRPPTQLGDDRRVIDLFFREAEAPIIRMEIQAKIRNSVSLFPTLIRLPRIARGEVVRQELELESYVASQGSIPRLRATGDWLRIGRPVAVIGPSTDSALHGRWTIPLTIDAGKLEPGSHEGRVEVLSDWWWSDVTATVPIEVTVVPPIEVSPSQLFFGTVRVGCPAEVRFALRSGPIPADRIRLEHNLGEQLVVEKINETGSASTWRATLTPKAATGVLNGMLTFSSIAGDTTLTKVPILARVQTNESR